MKMKHIISLFILSAMVAMSFKMPSTMSFPDLFKLAYEKSFDGLDKLKDERTGQWVFDNATSDFNVYEVKFDLDRGLHAMRFIKEFDSESTAQQMMGRYQIQLERLLPIGKYAVNNSLSSKNKTVFEYASTDINEKAKYPVAEILIEGDKESGKMTIQLLEPLNRKAIQNKK